MLQALAEVLVLSQREPIDRVNALVLPAQSRQQRNGAPSQDLHGAGEEAAAHDRPNVLRPVRRALRRQQRQLAAQPCGNEHCVRIHLDGPIVQHVAPLLANLRPCGQEGGRVPHVIGACSDVVPRDRAAERRDPLAEAAGAHELSVLIKLARQQCLGAVAKDEAAVAGEDGDVQSESQPHELLLPRAAPEDQEAEERSGRLSRCGRCRGRLRCGGHRRGRPRRRSHRPGRGRRREGIFPRPHTRPHSAAKRRRRRWRRASRRRTCRRRWPVWELRRP
mmetsp:Transcript_2037/g.5783  ORF Transcript_2037/g.5783 Transcript_2037/m.5783 type:complete len:277 (+) Transcript_2037:244-1074(+)